MGPDQPFLAYPHSDLVLGGDAQVAPLKPFYSVSRAKALAIRWKWPDQRFLAYPGSDPVLSRNAQAASFETLSSPRRFRWMARNQPSLAYPYSDLVLGGDA